MKKILLITAIAALLCLPVYAEQQFTNDSKYANEFPVFGNENQDLANLGRENIFSSDKGKAKYSRGKNYHLANQKDDEIDLKTGRIKNTNIKQNLTEEDKNYVPPINKNKKDGYKLPIYLDGDHIEFENATGDFVATGKVKVKQGQESLLTSYAFGNMKTGDVYLLEGGTVLTSGNRTEAKWVHYNFQNKTGELKEISGRGIKDIYRANHALVMPDKLLADQEATLTRCTAQKHVPCMHIEAKTIEIYPSDKLVAHNIKCFIKGKQIYSRKLWINELDKDRKSIITPRLGWAGKENGWFFKLQYDYDLSEKDKVSADFLQHSRSGYKPQYKFYHNEKNWDLRYMYGWEEHDDFWYHKQNDILLRYKPHYLIKGIPLTIYGDYEYGLWSKWNPKNQKQTHLKSGTKSWHSEYKFFVNHDPIKLFGPDTTLHLTYGRKWARENATAEHRVTNMYYQTIRQKIGNNIKLWVSNLREKQNDMMFGLGQPDMEREFRAGIQYKAGDNDTFSIVNRYDYGNNRQYETTYSWYHRFCCWALQFSYEKNWHAAYEKDKKDRHDFKLQFFFYNW